METIDLYPVINEKFYYLFDTFYVVELPQMDEKYTNVTSPHTQINNILLSMTLFSILYNIH